MDKFLRFSIVFLGTFLVLNFFFKPDEAANNAPKNDIEIQLTKNDYTTGDLVAVAITNNTDEKISLGRGTPPEFLRFSTFTNGELKDLQVSTQGEEVFLNPKSTKNFSFPNNNGQPDGQYC